MLPKLFVISILSFYELSHAQFSGMISLPGLPTACTTWDLKQCPDGTSVSRQGPDCKFPLCPGETTTSTTTTTTTTPAPVQGIVLPIGNPPPANPSIPSTTQATPSTSSSSPVNPITLPGLPGATPSTTTATSSTTAPIATKSTEVAPAGFAYGAFDQLCPDTARTKGNKCEAITNVISDTTVRCNRESECCLCQSIQCGTSVDMPCTLARFGSSAAYGVRDISITGDLNDGAIIECHGSESCRGSKMTASNVAELSCTGPKSCEGALISITDPSIDFALDCTGLGACNALKIDITITSSSAVCDTTITPKNIFNFGGIDCGNDESCKGLEITINNDGCDKVVIETLECLHDNACHAANFQFNGDIDIKNCQCGPSCDNALGLSKCFQNLAKLECPDAMSCMGANKMITNPLNGFEFKCGSTQSCQNANFHIELNQDVGKPEAITHLKGFIMGGENSAKDANIVISNDQGMDANGEAIVVNIDIIECSGHTACDGMTFVTGTNVNVATVKCSFNACAGCLIKKTLADAGEPCDPSQTTAAPGNVSPVVELPIGALPGTLTPPAATTKSPPLNIVLPPLPGMNPAPAPAPATPSTTAKTITLPIPTEPAPKTPATTAKVITLPTMNLPPQPKQPPAPMSTLALSTTTTTTTTSTTTRAPVTSTTASTTQTTQTTATSATGATLATSTTSTRAPVVPTTTTTTTTTQSPVNLPMIPVAFAPVPATPVTTRSTPVNVGNVVGNVDPRYVPI